MALSKGAIITIGVIAVIVILALIGILIWVFLIEKEGFPTNIRLVAQEKQWFLYWDAPSNPGNTGPLLYRIEVTGTSGTNNGQTRRQDGISTTNVLFPFQDPGTYSVNVYAYTSTQTSPPGTANVTVYGAPIVTSFDFANPNSINFASPITANGVTQNTGAPLTSVTNNVLTITDTQNNPVYKLVGTGSQTSDGYSFTSMFQIPQVTTYLIHDDVTPSQTATMTANMTSGIVYPISNATNLSLWSYDGTHVSLIQDTSYRWTWQQNQTLGAIVLGITNDPTQYGVVVFNSNGITTVSSPLGIYNIVYDIATTTSYIIGTPNFASAIAPTVSTFASLLDGGMKYYAIATVNNNFGSTNAQTPTYTIQSIAPSAPQNVKLVYQ